MLIPILLLNMLIAMMGNTYGIVIESAEKEFLKAWAKVMRVQRSDVDSRWNKLYRLSCRWSGL